MLWHQYCVQKSPALFRVWWTGKFEGNFLFKNLNFSRSLCFIKFYFRSKHLWNVFWTLPVYMIMCWYIVISAHIMQNLCFFGGRMNCGFEWQSRVKPVSQFSKCFRAPDNRRCFDNPVSHLQPLKIESHLNHPINGCIWAEMFWRSQGSMQLFNVFEAFNVSIYTFHPSHSPAYCLLGKYTVIYSM